MVLNCINIFAQSNRQNERKIYVGKPRSYGQFVLIFVIVENGQIADSPNFLIKYNKNGLKKIVNANFTPYTNYKFSYTNNGDIYIGTYDAVCYTTENFNNYLDEKFKANEGANFFNKLLHPKEAFLMACPDFFEMTNEERLEYFLNQVGQ